MGSRPYTDIDPYLSVKILNILFNVELTTVTLFVVRSSAFLLRHTSLSLWFSYFMLHRWLPSQ